MATEAPSVSLFAQLKATKRLPSPPGTALRILELCHREDTDIGDIAEAIMSDPALSGRILKFANSPLSALSRDVTSVREAVMLLGLRTLKLTALGFSLATPESGPTCPGFDLKRFWTESFLRAVIARRTTAAFNDLDREEAFTAGLLAGIGRVALVQGLKEEYASILQAATGGTPLVEVERERLGMDHAEFGALLLAEWQLPELLVAAVRYQHRTDRPDTMPAAARNLATVVGIAKRLVPCFVDEGGIRAVLGTPPSDIVQDVLKLDEELWNRTAEEILADFQRVAEVFNVRLDDQGSAMDLYAEAQDEATRVGMVTQLEQVKTMQDNENLLRRATTDPLTGVANRARFDERLSELVKGARRGHGDFALILFDIDHFKQFNDTHGHQVGDLVLKRVATATRNALREVDLVARYGGEEFTILAPHTDRKGACIVTARLQRCIEDLKIDVDGTRLSVTASSGLVITNDYDALPDEEKLVADADAQMYVSKKAGRNTWSYLGRSASKIAEASNRPAV